MAVYTVSFTVTADGITPAEVQAAGVFGDHLATELKITVPPEPQDCRYRLEITDGSGAYDTTELLDAQNGVVSFLIPRRWTAAGVAHVRLVGVKIDKNGEEELCFHAAPARLFFEERDDGEQMGDLTPAWQQAMTRVETVTETVRRAYEAGELNGDKGEKGDKGDKGDTGPKGEKGEKGDVGEGEAIFEQNSRTLLQFWVGTQAEYDALAQKQDGCFYLISDDKTLDNFVKRLDEQDETLESFAQKLLTQEQKHGKLVLRMDEHGVKIVRLQTHMSETLIYTTNDTQTEQEIQQRYKALPDTTFARYAVFEDGLYIFFEIHKSAGGWGHMERIDYGSRSFRTVTGGTDANGNTTYSFGAWTYFAKE